MANKLSLDFKGFEEMIAEIDGMGGDMQRAVDGALKQTKSFVTGQLEQEIGKHRRTGRTEASLDKDMSVEWDGTTASIDVGFHIRDGGLASVFLMYGTPRHGPVGKRGGHPGTEQDRALYDAIYGSRTKRQIKKLQEEAVRKVLKRSGGG